MPGVVGPLSDNNDNYDSQEHMSNHVIMQVL